MTQRDLDFEQRLRSAIRNGVDPAAPPWLRARIESIPDTIPTGRRGASPSWLSFTGRSVSVALVSIVIAASVGLGLLAYRNLGTAPPTPSPATRQGPVLRPDAAVMPIVRFDADAEGRVRADGRDAARAWVDIVAVRWRPSGLVRWSIELAGWPPSPEERDPDQIIEYGVVLDTNRDRVPDYEFGINNDAPDAGGFRVWVTDLATGDTDENDGPYGFPLEFSHPDEQDPDAPANGQPSMIFTFPPGSRPMGLPDKVGPPDDWQFYVWASVTEGGKVVALDYGPDFGWLTATAP